MTTRQIDVLEAAQQLSVCDAERLRLLFAEARRQACDAAGDFIELGVFRGGSALLLAFALQERASSRKLHLLDSWQGMPAPTQQDSGTFLRPGQFAAASEDGVRRMLAQVGLIDRCETHQGWFEQTLPMLPGPFAFAHVDCDFHAAVKFCLLHLLPRMAAGGTIVVDDYGSATERRFPGVEKAVDEAILGTQWRLQSLGGLRDQSVLLTR